MRETGAVSGVRSGWNAVWGRGMQLPGVIGLMHVSVSVSVSVMVLLLVPALVYVLVSVRVDRRRIGPCGP